MRVVKWAYLTESKIQEALKEELLIIDYLD
jgi:hypothetical protein